MRHLRGWPDHLHVNTPNRASLLRHVLTGHGVFLRFPAHSAVGICNGRTAQSEEGGYTCAGNGCVQCD